MHCKFLMVFLCSAAMLAVSVEIPFKCGDWSGVLDSKGAILKELHFKEKRMTTPGNETFMDSVMGDGGGKIELCEELFKLEFEPKQEKSNKVFFSACANGAFAGLRVNKTYDFNTKKPEFTVTWEYRNIGDKTLSAGLRTKCFFRNDDSKVSVFHFPQNGKIVSADYPGATLSDIWITEPGLAFAAVHGKNDKTGLLVLPPKDLLGTLFCYFNQTRVLNTQEFFLNDQLIEAGKTISFSIKVIGSDDIPAELEKQKVTERKITELKGKKLRMPLRYTVRKDAVLISTSSPVADEHLDIFPERQLDESFRTLELPPEADVNALSLYELANGAIVPDRPVPFRVFKDEAGKNILKFRVPGVNPHKGGSVTWRDGGAWEAYGRKNFICLPQYPCRLLFRKGGKIDETIPPGDAELIYNGDFSKPYAEDPTIPDGYRNQFIYDRERNNNNLSFMNPGVRLVWDKNARKQSSSLTYTVRLERGIKYNFSTNLSCTNPSGNWVVISLSFFDAENKALGKTYDVRLNAGRNALPLAERSKSFYPPAGAVRGEICLRVYDHVQEMKIYKLSLKPEPLRVKSMTPEELLRNEMKSSTTPALDLIEKLDFSTVTPHREFFPNPAEQFPKLLYLTGNSGTFIVKQVHRRHLIELCERAKFDYTYIPLLRKIASSRGGKWHFDFADTLEPYTLVRLANIKTRPEAVMINQADFKYIPPETVNMLKEWRNQGTPLVFFNCKDVPKDLLGKRAPVPAHIFATLPEMRNIPPKSMRKNLQFFTEGKVLSVCWNTGNFEYLNLSCLPFVPAEKADEIVPNLYGADYPYWEYFYLAQLKVLRHAAGKEGPVVARKAVAGELTLESASPCEVKVATVVRDYYGRIQGEAQGTFKLEKGISTITPPLPEKPFVGGISIVDFKVLDKEGRDLDCGAYKVDTPALPLEITMGEPESIFSRAKAVTFSVKSVPGAVYDCEIVDTEGRSVWHQKGSNVQYSAMLHFPYTRLYNLYVRAESEDKSALLQKEFSVEAAPINPYDVDAVIWMNRPAYSRLVRDLGFNIDFTNFGLNHMRYGSLRAMATNGCEPVSVSSGHVLNNTLRVYRGDVETDPVHNPCYSDLERKKEVYKTLAERVGYFRGKYYGVRYHIIADEAFLGRSVCFSPHCLNAFRIWLKDRYASLDELNRSWGTSYVDWKDVTPVQFKELKDKEHMAQYVEHKWFMNYVFARDWVGTTGEGLARAYPGSIAGLSGTQEPGFSYDWVQMMKYNPLLMYYGGAQINAVLDFAPDGSKHGQWLGYTRGFKDNEVLNKGRIWLDIFRGANLICKYSCESFRGDVTPTPNARYFSEAVKEIRSGIGSRILHGKKIRRDVGILYSQLSLLCGYSNAAGRQNMLNIWNSWPALLTDLGLQFRMVSYEELDERIPECKVLVLPAAFSLSRKQLANLKKYTEAGGIVLADCGAGWYDGHGNRADDKTAEDFFGIDRSQAQLFPSDAPMYKALPPGELNLKLTDGKAAITEGGLPFVITKNHGKGKAVLLNLVIGSYFTIKLGGVGGEEALAKGGLASTQQMVRELTAPLLSTCEVPFEVKGVQGSTLFIRQDGRNYYAGILPPIVDVPHYDMLKYTPAEVRFPVKGHIYLMRTGEYLGHSDTCKVNLRSGDAVVFSILPEKVKSVKVDAPKSIKAGDICKIRFSAEGGVGSHVFHVEIRRPDGSLPFGYWWNSYASDGEHEFQFAANDVPGEWKIVVRDIDTGMTAASTIKLEN